MRMIFIDNQIFGGTDIAKLRPAQSNFTSVGWAKLALILTFTHPPTHPPRESTEKVITVRLFAKIQS